MDARRDTSGGGENGSPLGATLPDASPVVGGRSHHLPLSLPCVRGGGAQPRWGCGVCGISRSRAAAESSQSLSQLRCQLPLHKGAALYPGKPPLCKGRWGAAPEGLWSLRSYPVYGQHQQVYNPSVAYGASSPYTGEPISTPGASPVEGEVGRSPGGVVEFAVISRLRAAPASFQPLSQLRCQLPLHRGTALYPGSLPCVRGGGAQPRRGCGVCGISRLRAAAESSQSLSRLRRQLPLHKGAALYPGKGIQSCSVLRQTAVTPRTHNPHIF